MIMKTKMVLATLCCVLSTLPLLSLAFSTSAPIDAVNGAAVASKADPSSSSPQHVLAQNWWPVALTDMLSEDRPNPIELLGRKLVLFHDGDAWKCLDDKCSHRFAPLSEGRLVETQQQNSGVKCLQCAYHGWEFQGDGALSSCPQADQSLLSSSSSIRRSGAVTNYPVQTGGGMIWVWADSDTANESKLTKIPVSPLLEQYVQDYPNSGFQRDLPYGYEILGENLLDVAHLPFSHHGAGGFNRDLARPVSLRLMSDKERRDEALSESQTAVDPVKDENSVLTPIFEGKLANASVTDPTLLMLAKTGRTIPENATSSSAFYAPSHIRYRRNRGPGNRANIELFICPTSPGTSRVFLFTAIERVLKRSLRQHAKKQKSVFGRIKASFTSRYIRTVLQPNWKGHMVAHDIFDGDNIFLRKQAETMHREGLHHKQYFTPTTADILVRSFRKWIDSAKDSSRILGNPQHEQLSRIQLLDRYSTHTANCKVCQKALKRFQLRKKLLLYARNVFLGAVGASLVSTLTSARKVLSLASVALALIGVAISDVLQKRTEEDIQKFHFVDYDHAKN